MIISHKYKFIFIKTRKTAGTSIEVFLSNLCGEEDVFTPIFPSVDSHVSRNFEGFWNVIQDIAVNSRKKEYKNSLIFKHWIKRQKFFNHIPAYLVKSRVSKNVWNSYYKFCVERNPWDKTYSQYNDYKNRLGGELSTYDYFKNYNCSDFFMYTEKGNLIVDEVLDFENLSNDLSRVFNKLGIPFSGDLGVKAKGYDYIKKLNYKDVFNKNEISLIDEIFRKEIEFFKYSRK